MIDHTKLLIFDIETVPDGEAATTEEFVKPLFHKVVAISYVRASFTDDEHIAFEALRSASEPQCSERELVGGFLQLIEETHPRLVTFNGRGFDLPVLKYRAMLHGLSAPWLMNGQSRWECYSQRYSIHWHCDLMDALSDFGATKASKLSEVCSLLGVPSKSGMNGANVAEMISNGAFDDVRHYCERDVMATYVIYLRYALLRGELDKGAYAASIEQLERKLASLSEESPHVGSFLSEWMNTRKQPSAAQ